MAGYILGEDHGETERLRAQAAELPVAERVRWGGLAPGMRVVDAGCGPGEIARELAAIVGPTGTVDAFDMSEARLAAGRTREPLPGSGPLRFHVGSIYEPPVPAGQADFVFSQFVFEYLPEPQRAAIALKGTLRPGGVLCLCDADSIGGMNWPMPEAVAQGMRRLLEGLAPTGFDALAGRKLFTWLVDAGLSEVRVRVDPLVFAGPASPAEIANWKQRFAGIAPAGAHIFGGTAPYEAFVASYLSLLEDARSLKMTNIVTASGRLR